MIPCQRHLFELPREVSYLNCAYMSPLMRPVLDAGRAGLSAKARPWKIRPADFFSDSERVRSLFAALIGADAEGVAMVPAASYGIAVAAANLPVSAGEEILVLEDQFPSNFYAWRERARRGDARLRVVGRPANGDWTAAVTDAIGPRTAVVALPHCHWTDGGLLELEAIGVKCRKHGAALVLDLTQSAGALAFDASRVQPDFAVAAGYKWLLGPYSLGCLWVAPRWRDGVPLEESWIARAGSENFARLVDYEERYQPGARRFDVGERANFALLPMLRASLEQILEWRVERIAATLAKRTEQIASRLGPLGFRTGEGRMRAGHFLGVRLERGLPPDLPERLAARNVWVSIRGNAMRITPHVYNDDQDVDRLVEALQEVLSEAHP